MVLVLSSLLFLPQRNRIAELANAHRLPSMFIAKHWVEAGGLMAYGADFRLMFRRAADYVAKILKGAKPADLPVEQATKFELIVNLRTAKAIGIEPARKQPSHVDRPLLQNRKIETIMTRSAQQSIINSAIGKFTHGAP